MPEVLEIAKVETEQNQELPKADKDTWIFTLPAETCRREGFAEGTMVSLTVKNSGIQTSFIRPPMQKLQDISKKLIAEDRELHEELKKIGD